MTGFGGVSGTVCDATDTAILSEAVCQCTDGTAAPISDPTLEQCCAACSTPDTHAESVQYNSASEVCPAVTGATSPTPSSGGSDRARTPASYGYVNPLGTTNINTVIGRIIRVAIGTIGALFFAMFVWGGALWMTAGGEAERVKKAKQALFNALIGMAVVVFSYMIINVLFGIAGALTG